MAKVLLFRSLADVLDSGAVDSQHTEQVKTVNGLLLLLHKQ